MKVKIWGCRGSIPSPGPEKNIYGGNTTCVQVVEGNTCLVIDGGSGIQNLGASLGSDVTEVHLLLTHLHIDHIIGLGFFQPFFNPKIKVHIWGPAASKESLVHRLRRYFSPPIFPVRLSELPCQLEFHEISQSTFEIGPFKITSDYVIHPGPTVGYRIQQGDAVLAFIPDHEPALGAAGFPGKPEWTSGFTLSQDADLLIHDAQYQAKDYPTRLGWGHSSMNDAMKFGTLTRIKKMLLFHHDPLNSDSLLEKLFQEAIALNPPGFQVALAKEGETYLV